MRMLKVFFILITLTLVQCAALEQLLQKPTVSYERLTMDNLSFTKGTFIFQFQVTNPNPVGFSIRQIDYDIRLSDVSIVNGSMKTLKPIEENGDYELQLPINIGFLKLGQSVYQILKSSSANYTINGHIKSKVDNDDQRSFPFQKSGQVSISR